MAKDKEQPGKNEQAKEKGKQAKPAEKAPAKPKAPIDENMRHIVRIAGKDLDGTMPICMAIAEVKGVGSNLASSIARIFVGKEGISGTMQLGKLTEAQSDELADIILNPMKYGVPVWQVNRRKSDKKENIHLTGHDLDYVVKTNIDIEKKARSYKGVRHSLGLTVRGQRTRTSGRKGTTIGVTRRKDVKGSGK